MKWVAVVVLGAHALLHLLGFAKAWDFASLPQLTSVISRTWGLGWLMAGLLVAATTVLLAIDARQMWLVGAVALLLSQAVVVSAWHDAWAGTLANLLLLLVVTHGWLTEGPGSYRARFDREVSAGLTRAAAQPLVTEADLAPLPVPVQRYLRRTGAVGQPRVWNYHVRFRGRIRNGPEARWMPFEAEQMSFADQPTRLFLMRARMFGVPVEAFHQFGGGHASMKVTLAGAFRIEDARGPEMDRAETVTHFNDMCLMAPATLIDPRIAWESVDDTTARARFTSADQTIAATLHFDNAGQLVNFVSDDRARTEEGGVFRPRRFSTPVRDYRQFGATRVMSYGEARWRMPDSEFTYGEFHVLEVVYNVR